MKSKTRSLLLLFFILSHIGYSQDIDLNSPYQCVKTHLKFLHEDGLDISRATKSFALSKDSIIARSNAIQLKQIWDSKGMYVYVDKMPHNNDYIDSLSNKGIYTVFPKKMPEIYLAKKNGNWYYSEFSCNAISDLHEKTFPYGISSILSSMPMAFTKSFLNIQIWQWLAIICLIFFAFILQWLISKTIRPLLQKTISKRLNLNWSKNKNIHKLSKYLATFLVLIFIHNLLPIIMLPIFISKKLFLIIYVLKTLVVVMILLKVIDVFMNYLRQITSKTETKMDDQLAPIIYRFLQFIVIIFALVYILQKLDVNVTALFAGLSIGGLALALASQDTVKNLIGSAMIFVDRPFQIGDYIQGGGIEGTVVEVGFRTTRLKASDTSIISVPNGTMANLSLTNKGVRVLRLYNTTLGLEYGTSTAKINTFMAGLKDIILKEDLILKENYYIGLINLGESTLDILFRFYIDTKGYDDELMIKNKINLAVLTLSEEVGVSFAFPSRTIYNG